MHQTELLCLLFLNQALRKIIGQQYVRRGHLATAQTQSMEAQAPHNQPLVMVVYYNYWNLHLSHTWYIKLSLYAFKLFNSGKKKKKPRNIASNLWKTGK